MEHSKIVVIKHTIFILSDKNISEVDSPGVITGTMESLAKVPFSFFLLY